MYTGSHSMFSECLHSLADTVNQLILAYGIHKSSQVCSLSSYPFHYLYTYGREVIYFIIINNMLYLCHINHVHSKCPLSTTIPPKQKKRQTKQHVILLHFSICCIAIKSRPPLWVLQYALRCISSVWSWYILCRSWLICLPWNYW
jgi:divalent metal cation (Fe/Co/Zn/Cd) transporter